MQIVKSFSKLRADGPQASRRTSASNYGDESGAVGAIRKIAYNNLVNIAGGEVNHEANIVSAQNSRTLFRRRLETRRDLIAF